VWRRRAADSTRVPDVVVPAPRLRTAGPRTIKTTGRKVAQEDDCSSESAAERGCAIKCAGHLLARGRRCELRRDLCARGRCVVKRVGLCRSYVPVDRKRAEFALAGTDRAARPVGLEEVSATALPAAAESRWDRAGRLAVPCGGERGVDVSHRKSGSSPVPLDTRLSERHPTRTDTRDAALRHGAEWARREVVVVGAPCVASSRRSEDPPDIVLEHKARKATLGVCSHDGSSVVVGRAAYVKALTQLSCRLAGRSSVLTGVAITDSPRAEKRRRRCRGSRMCVVRPIRPAPRCVQAGGVVRGARHRLDAAVRYACRDRKLP